MLLITYKLVDGHKEEIEVSDEVAAVFATLEKYSTQVESTERWREGSLN